MFRYLAAVVAVGALVGCSSTDAETAPSATASTAYQQQVDSFCQDVKDALQNDGAGDPEDEGERTQELLELAQELGQGSRDNIAVADQLNQCKQELQDAINGESPSPSP